MRKLNSITAVALSAPPVGALAHPGHSGAASAVHAHSVTEALLLGALFAVIAVGVGLGLRRIHRKRH